MVAVRRFTIFILQSVTVRRLHSIAVDPHAKLENVNLSYEAPGFARFYNKLFWYLKRGLDNYSREERPGRDGDRWHGMDYTIGSLITRLIL